MHSGSMRDYLSLAGKCHPVRLAPREGVGAREEVSTRGRVCIGQKDGTQRDGFYSERRMIAGEEIWTQCGGGTLVRLVR